MSLLPQRKKSAEEIAKLRGELGIPVQAPVAEEAPVHAAQKPAAVPAPAPEPKQFHSFKKSEWIPEPPADEPEPPAAPVLDSLPGHATKPVRSLRKSEQVPLPVAPPEPAPDSKLPIQRRSAEEIMRIRRQETISMQTTPMVHPKLIAAHPAWILPGYLLPLIGAVSFYYYYQPIYVPAACVAASLIVATWIFLKKPMSRHHAAFISVVALLVIAFGALHYFPQLRHVS
ncbi:MAG: hypothetical protein WED15_05355 [Akkermansiaceae bacterium]